MTRSIRLMVTGATGLVGANVCRSAAEAGLSVRALTRPGAETWWLDALGVHTVAGDVTDPSSLSAAADGTDAIIHTAAVLGTPGARFTDEQYEAVNHLGTINVLEAASAAGVSRVVAVTTNILFKQTGRTCHTEQSRLLDDNPAAPAYYRSKRAAFVAAMERVQKGQDIVTVVPGAIFGPAPSGRRVLDPASFNAMLLDALLGRVHRFPKIPFAWVSGQDVARVCLSALERGAAGQRYLAMGRPEDVTTFAGLANSALGLLGLPPGVEDIEVADDDPDLSREFKGIEEMARWHWPVPLFDATVTEETLGYHPTPLADSLQATLDWLASVDDLSAITGSP